MQADELSGIVGQRISALIHDMEAVGWAAGDVVKAIREALHGAGHDQPEVLQRVREKVSQDFVSDGNEG